MAVVHVINGRQKKLFGGHPWVYRNEIERIEGDFAAGDDVDVVDFRGRYIGRGFINPGSVITVRILTNKKEDITGEQIRERVRNAVRYRAYFRRDDTDCERLVFAEADLLPGVIAERFGDAVVLQTLALGMQKYEEIIADSLIEEVDPKTLVLRNDEPIRSKEGMKLFAEKYYGEDIRKTIFKENGIKFEIDLYGGQKTGGFLDQKANHRRLRSFVKGKRVLDCFAYSGGFALNAVAGGASSVTAVDISEEAIDLVSRNAGLNGIYGLDIVKANAFDFLRESAVKKERYDVIVLDPPAFTKSKSALSGAVRGYKEINLSAMRLLRQGGILATHSCSYHMPEDLFVNTVLSAATDLRRKVRIIGLYGQDNDHPVLAGYPESKYLKSLWLEMLN
ncbi:class I SAM-dependent rRNA methyltransferase [Candidatus Nomurabacteria bacterium]|nr:class I SAM-dependent rRNA methyltransferase [Candidatus Nomurabacteria bacterium]